MKKLAMAVLGTMVCSTVSWGANGPFGAGVVIGEPTGLSAKYWTDASRIYAADLGVAWSLSGDNNLHLHGDYLYHNYSLLHDALRINRGRLPVYAGIGGRVKFRENRDDRVGVRIPFGVSYLFPEAPLELFGEIVPIVDFAPDTKGDLGGGVGLRFYF